MIPLPIETITPELLSLIPENDCILSAPPGAGKSTYLPLQLLSLAYFSNKKILLLQPRQVAVRSIANFLALSLGEKVGRSIGYQMRGESALSDKTRLCVITEGLLVAKMQSDPELNDVGLIIFDEFHERSVQSDIALGLCLEVQSALRPDLRLLVMSATLNVADLSTLMPNARQLSSSGRTYPIDYIYKPISAFSKLQRSHNKPNNQLINAVVNTVAQAHHDHSGNILVFLPGAAIINKVQSALDRLSLSDTLIAPLYGALTTTQQKQAIDIPPGNKRKIVLATNIAETSLTINGVNIVIDSGREKAQRFIVSRKLHQLSEQMISKASSIQRAGRAGRQQAGVCYRLWSQEQQQFLQENAPAQITQVDISQTLLTLLQWGTDFTQLPLIDKPSEAQVDYAFSLLKQLGFLNQAGHISASTKLACQFNTHPRLARMLVIASTQNCEYQKILSAVLVALIEGKPLGQMLGSNDIVFQCRYVLTQLNNKTLHKGMFELNKDISRIAKQLGIKHVNNALLESLLKGPDLAQEIANILLAAYPDKIGRKRDKAGFTIADGTGAELMQNDEDIQAHWIICTQTQITHKTNAMVRQYCELSGSALNAFLDKNTHSEKQQYWDNALDKVVCRQVARVGAIEISSQVCSFSADYETTALLLKQIRKKGLIVLLGKANVLLSRIKLLEALDNNASKDSQGISQSSLIDSMEMWLVAYLNKVTTWQQLVELNWLDIVRASLSYAQLVYLDEYFPLTFMAPTGNRHSLDYSEQGKVSLAIRIQELYGLNTHPRVGRNSFPITLSLLSPAHSLIQKTADLPTFWSGSYREVQKDMKGRYPRHYWPENPESAVPTTKTKKKM